MGSNQSPARAYTRPVAHVAADAVAVKLDWCNRMVAELARADASSGQAERCIGRSAQRDEQSEESDGVVTDEREGLEHWTRVLLIGCRGRPCLGRGCRWRRRRAACAAWYCW